MIPSIIDAETRERFVVNVITAYRHVTPEQRSKGERWYPLAHKLAGSIGRGDVAKGAGVIAALSANKRWSENVMLATAACKLGKATGTFGDALRKADAIMGGMPPEFVLPMEFKTGNFYRCIIDPADPEAVCVDRHAHDIAVGETYGDQPRGLSAKGRYAAIADVYREAARRLGVNPATVQAVTWVAHTA